MRHRVIVGSIVVLVATAGASAALVSAALWPAGDSRPVSAVPRSDPAAFVSRIVSLVTRDEYGRAWDDLYPMHQQVATRGEYIACELQTPVGGVVRTVDVVRVVDEQARIPGQSQRVAAKAVTLRITLFEPSMHARDVFTHTFHAVPVGSRWTWILSPRRYALYRSDACGV